MTLSSHAMVLDARARGHLKSECNIGSTWERMKHHVSAFAALLLQKSENMCSLRHKPKLVEHAFALRRLMIGRRAQ